MKRRATLAERLRRLAERQPDFRERYSNIELAKKFGVSRQAIHAAIGRNGGLRRRARKPRAPRKASAQRPRVTLSMKLRRLEADEPDFRERYLQGELAARFGVTRQAVSVALGKVRLDRHTIRRRRAADRLAAFIREHPDALRSRLEGGMTRQQVARAVGVSVDFLRRLCEELEVPTSKPGTMHRNSILRVVTCIECGRAFDWTRAMECNHRQGMKRYITCGKRCAAIHRERRKRGALVGRTPRK